MTQSSPQMDENEKRAWAIYESICASGAERPSAFNGVDEMRRVLGEWDEKYPPFVVLREASPPVLLAFLRHSIQWLDAEAKPHNYKLINTLFTAVRFSLTAAPKPLPSDLILGVLREANQNILAGQVLFPIP